MSRRFIGIEIGAARVRAVQLLRNRGAWRMECCAEQPLPPGAATQESGEALRTALETLMRDGGFRAGAPAAVCMPPGTVFFQSLDTDLLKLEDVRRVIGFETEGDFPFPPDQLVLDICSARKLANDRQRILVGAVSRQALERTDRTIHQARVSCVRLDAAACALLPIAARSCPQDGLAGGAFITLDLSEDQCLLVVAGDGKPASVRRFAVLPGAPDAPAHDMIREMELSWRDVFGEAIPPATPCVVGGDEARAAETRAALAQHTTLRVVALNALAGIEAPGQLPPHGPSAIAVGMALEAAGEFHGMNFPAADAARLNAEKKIVQALLVGLLLVAALAAAWTAGQYARLSALRQQQRAIRSATNDLERDLFPVSSNSGGKRPQEVLAMLKDQMDKQQKEYAALGVLSSGALTPLDVLNIISTRIPARLRMKLLDLTIRESTVRMTVTTDSYPTLDGITAALKDEPQFEKFTVSDVASVPGALPIRFILTFSVRPRT